MIPTQAHVTFTQPPLPTRPSPKPADKATPVAQIPRPIPDPLNQLVGYNLTVTTEFTTHFLIGTTHIVDEESFDNQAIQKIINSCSFLYTEAGKHTFNLRPGSRKLKGNPKYAHIPVRFPYDAAIALAAEKKKIPNIGLDIGNLEFDAVCRENYANFAKLGPAESERRMMEIDASKQHELSLQLKMWKAGNAPALKELRQEIYLTQLERENRWCQVLIPHLRTAREPIAIAVGALHVLGHKSLSERFKEEGFEVKYLTSLDNQF